MTDGITTILARLRAIERRLDRIEAHLCTDWEEEHPRMEKAFEGLTLEAEYHRGVDQYTVTARANGLRRWVTMEPDDFLKDEPTPEDLRLADGVNESVDAVYNARRCLWDVM